MRIATLVVTLILTSTLLFADEIDELFVQGNMAYKDGNFEQAIARYNDILSRGYESSQLYFNLGNAYYRLIEIGEAVLYYEKAKKLDPQDADIRYNLDLANLRVIDRVEVPPRFFLFKWWDAVRQFFSITELSYLVIGFFALASVLLVLWFFARRDRLRRSLMTFAGISGVLLVFWLYVFVVRVQENRDQRNAVILDSSVTAKSAPDEESTDMFVLHEGIKVHLDEQRDDWVKISLPDGKSGWIPGNVFGII